MTPIQERKVQSNRAYAVASLSSYYDWEKVIAWLRICWPGKSKFSQTGQNKVSRLKSDYEVKDKGMWGCDPQNLNNKFEYSS